MRLKLASPRKRGRQVFALGVVLCASAWLVTTAGASSATNNLGPGASFIQIPNFVKYDDGKPGSANPKLSPVEIGWSNNQGGSIIPSAAEATPAAQIGVDWINKYADGIDGHPLKLDECFVKNSEEEGLGCAESFLANPKVEAISFGALPVGATTIDSTVNGKKPIITGVALNNGDAVAKNTYILYIVGDFSVYSWGGFAKSNLHAKTVAVLYPEQPGIEPIGAATVQSNKAAGLKTTLVGFDPTSTDLLGAATAAGVQKADAVEILGQTGGQCVALAQAFQELGVNPSKVISFTNCIVPASRKDFPGGDYPKWNYGISQSGSNLADDATGRAFQKAESTFGAGGDTSDPWYSGMFGTILTIAKFMNEVGYNNLTPSAVAAKAKAFKGPLLLGGPVVQCDRYREFPNVCGGGQAFFKYAGNNKFVRSSNWVLPPLALQRQFGLNP